MAKIESGRSPGTLENEKLPFAMRLRYSWLNGPYAASTTIHDAVSMRFERPVSGFTSRVICIERDYRPFIAPVN